MTAITRPMQLDSGDDRIRSQMALFRAGSVPVDGLIPVHRLSLSGLVDSDGWRAAQAVARASGRQPGALSSLRSALRYRAIRDELRRTSPDLLLIWRGVAGRALLGRMAAQSLNIPCLFVENAPVSGWCMADFQGIDARCSVPRDPGFFSAWRQTTTPGFDWRKLRQGMRSSRSDSGRVGQAPRHDWADEPPFLFVPFQLNRAGEYQHDGGWVADPAQLVTALADAARALPKGWHLRLKPHPNAAGDLATLLARIGSDRLRLDADTDSLDQLAASRGVVTVNSAMGFEAFLMDKPTITLGNSWYGGPGRTIEARSSEALAELLCQPDELGFDPQIRDDLLCFLFNDCFHPIPALRAGEVDLNMLAERAARHRALQHSLRPPTGDLPSQQDPPHD